MIVIASIYILVNLVLTALATWAQKKFVGEKKPLEVSLVGNLNTGAAPPPPLSPSARSPSAGRSRSAGPVRWRC